MHGGLSVFTRINRHYASRVASLLIPVSVGEARVSMMNISCQVHCCSELRDKFGIRVWLSVWCRQEERVAATNSGMLDIETPKERD